MSLTLALNNALSGLNVNQRTMAVISNNIANANTDGYSRQVVDLASVTYDGTGQGVRVEDIVRKIDEYLQTAINRQTSEVGKAEVINEFMERAQILLGDPSAQNSIDAHLETLFNDLQVMAETPERTSTRSSVVESAVMLSREISNLAEGLEELRMQADIEVSQGIKAVNAALKKLHTINESIIHADAFGTSKASLLDQRDTALKQITEYLDVRTYQQETGAIHIYVGQGIPLLDDSAYEISYNKISSIGTLIDDSTILPIQIYQLREDGSRTGYPIELATQGSSADIVKNFSSGKLAGLLELRDEIFPGMLQQIDMLASRLRDEFNAIHNQGTGYPAATELTGTRSIIASERSAWTGQVRIAVLDKDGYPAPSVYSGEETGFRPLTLDLESLYNGVTYGEPDLQTIIDEINNHFGVPQNQLKLGNFNQIQLALSSDRIPGSGASVSFDFDIENISNQYGDFWVNSVQVVDDTGAAMTPITDTMPSITLGAANTFITANTSDLVEITTATQHSLKVGDRIRLNDPGMAINGIPGAVFANYYEIEAITGNSFTVRLPVAATATGPVAVVGQTASPPYGTIEAGEKSRVQQNGSITASLSNNINSAYYDVTVTLAVRQEDGTIASTPVTYRIQSPQTNARNDRVSASYAPPGGAELILPNTTQGYLKAIMVDENGVELPKTNGEYGDQTGYLKIISLDPDYTVALDEMDSKHIGWPNDIPPRAGSNRGFSHYFELNNFFQSNSPTDTGDTLKNSALYMEVETRFQANPSLLSTGKLALSNQPADPTAYPLYTYERLSGDNGIAQKLAKIGISSYDFPSAGGLPDTSLSFNGYAGEMLGYMTTLTVSASANLSNSSVLLQGYQERADAISGVNLDEELANTIIYQNAYTASARVITATDELFNTLLDLI